MAQVCGAPHMASGVTSRKAGRGRPLLVLLLLVLTGWDGLSQDGVVYAKCEEYI
jgi:hypothetical protein